MFSRFKALENYGEQELEKLEESKAAVIGLGATGSVIAENLARHGLELILVDRDYLETKDCYSSNIYMPEDCRKAMPKAEVAGEKLSRLTEVESNVESLKPENIEMLNDADIILDGTDNMETRFLINEYCQKEGKPWIYTAALAEKGYSMFLMDKCFNCIFEKVKPGELDTCESRGVMREVSSGIASISSLKAVRYLTGKDIEEKLDTFNGESFEVPRGECEVCKGESFPRLESGSKTYSVCGENKFQIERDIGEEALESLKSEADSFTENEYLVKAKIEGRDFTLFSSGRAIIEARDRGHAEAIFSEIIGV